MCSQVTKWGNSLAIRIPKAIAEQLSLAEDSAIDVRSTTARS
ncbi:MAG: AbrB/MazE/SpoVT family DNA-binding domain-containing protein [Polyangia bacterium]